MKVKKGSQEVDNKTQKPFRNACCRRWHKISFPLNLLVLNQRLQLQDQLTGDAEHSFGVVPFGHFCSERMSNNIFLSEIITFIKSFTVEEFDDIGEIHGIGQNDVAIVLDKCEGHEQDEMWRSDRTGRPNCLPNGEHVIVHQFCRKK